MTPRLLCLAATALAVALLPGGCTPDARLEPAPAPAAPAAPGPAVTPLARAVSQLVMPPGFRMEVFADGIEDARSLARGPNGTIFVGSRRTGLVRAVRDDDGDHRADRTFVLARGLHMPNGVAVRDGALYVAEVHRILRFDAIEDNLGAPPVPAVVRADYPRDDWHGWKFIAFSPDGRLHVPVGAPCNTCDREEPYASITSIAADGSDRRIVARGVRNTVGFDWHPRTGELWFTDNGRDMLGDDIPSDEINRVTSPGQHFGFPYCHQGDLPDPDFGAGRRCADYVAPAALTGAHVANLGMRFYRGSMFPEKYRGALFYAEHGSWNRTVPDGYRVSVAFLDETGTRVTGIEHLVTGFLEGEQAWGRPVDVLELPDGSLLISDDRAGAIYRLTWSPPAAN